MTRFVNQSNLYNDHSKPYKNVTYFYKQVHVEMVTIGTSDMFTKHTDD